jgi:hypothetical protein
MHPVDPGHCVNEKPKNFNEFSYDSSLNKCKPFVYSGCFGNENRFGTMHECKLTCEVDL